MSVPAEVMQDLPSNYTDKTNDVFDPEEVVEMSYTSDGIVLVDENGGVLSFIDNEQMVDVIAEWHNGRISDA